MMFIKIRKLTMLQTSVLLLAVAFTIVVAGCAEVGGIDLSIPKASDFVIDNLDQTDSLITAVTITPKEGKSTGAVTIYYTPVGGPSTKSTELPTTAGTYTVTFDVAAVGDWKAIAGLRAGTLTITGEDPTNFFSGKDWGLSSSASVLTLGLTPGNNTTEINLNWYSSGSTAGKSAQVRFVRGTFTAGFELIEKPGTVDTASSGYTQHKVTVTGLKPGASYQYAVSSDGTNWSDAYNFKIPATNAPFKFAVIADPQLNTTYDTFNRYTPVGATAATSTPLGWKEAVQKIVAAGASFIASAGDQVDTAGNESQYTDLFAPDGIRSLPLAPVIGNHDTAANFFYHYNIPNEQGTASSTDAGGNYYYLYNRILFVGLNTAPYPGQSAASASAAAPYITRFKTTIQAAKAAHAGKYDWLIVHHHKSTASVAVHLADRDIESYVLAGFETLMSDMGVDFVLAGHDHVYARSYPLQGMDNGKVSVPDKSNGTNQIYTNPGKPIYLTFTTASGLKYYPVASDPYFKYGTAGSTALYVTNNTTYPYLGETSDNGVTSTKKGSTDWLTGLYTPVSNAAFVQPWIPSYTIVEVNGKTIKFSTYPIGSATGTSTGASQAYSFDANTPYDWVQVTKN